MIKSMTGFGRCEISDEERKITVELKSVNHRYNEVSIRMPKTLNFFESNIRAVLKEYCQRGKVDIFITYEDLSKGRVVVKYNEELAAEYFKCLTQISETFNLENDVRVSTLSRYPDVFTVEEQSENIDEIWNHLEKALRGAFEQFVNTRIAEGERLKTDILSKLDFIDEQVDKIIERSPEIVKEHREKIMAKVNELLGDTKINETLLATEITMYADRICTDEETVRLKSHVQQVRDTLTSEDNVGRKLDFIAQEMNREANTILSKANDIEVSNIAIGLKTEIEKIREQIQNIE